MKLRRLTPPLAAFSIFLVGCGDSSTGTEPDPPEAPAPPSVELSVGLDLQDSSRSDTLTVAEGERVILEWSTTDDPSTCTAGGSWSGGKSVSGGEEVSSPLSSLGSASFTLECENAGGAERASVDVEVRDDQTFHVRSDRVDDVGGAQIHLLYIVLEDGFNPLELRDMALDSLFVAQDWFRSETDGRELRIDTYDGEPDLTLVRLPYTGEEVQSFDRIMDEMRDELQHRGFDDEEKKYLIYYNGVLGREDQGGEARDPYGAVYFQGGGYSLIMIHEFLHTLGIVDEDAPNFCDSSHVCDSARDLMRGPSVSGPAFPKVLDIGKDDYYSSDLPEGMANLYFSSFITQP